MKNVINALLIPVCLFCGAKAAITLWPIDSILSVLTGLAFMFLIVDAVEEIGKDFGA